MTNGFNLIEGMESRQNLHRKRSDGASNHNLTRLDRQQDLSSGQRFIYTLF
jgi:hypothetical protein